MLGENGEKGMSRSPENILLHLPDDEDQRIRDLFLQLETLGFPRQQQTPHISITFAPAMDPAVVERARELLPAVIPSKLHRVGTVVFGTKRKQTVAWLLEASDELEIAARSISALNAEGRGPRWTPHLTMGLRLPREIVPDYIRALDELTSPYFKELTADRAVYWKPKVQELQILAARGLEIPS